MADAPQNKPESFATRFKQRASAFGSAVKRAALRAGRWPWTRIGLWAGGAAGALVVSLILFLTFADWNAFKGPISRMASAATGREIVIKGDLDVDPWSFTPKIHVSGLQIGNPTRYRERGQFADVRDASAAVQLLPLLIGRFEIVRLDLNGADIELYRSAEGDGNWASVPSVARKPVRLPAIQRFSLRDGRVRYVDDKRRMELNATFQSRESAVETDPGQFALTGEGRLNGRPFTLELTGAALINVRRDRPYGFNADVRMGGTRLVAEGAIRKPFDLTGFEANIDATGPDLADLYYLIGLTLPNTPPYRLSGRVSRTGPRYELTGLGGRVGDSDLSGQFSVEQRNGRPFLDGDFRTRSLDFDDAMAVLGGPPSTQRGETASPEQRAEAQHMAAAGRLLPDARLDIQRVRNMDARVSYRAARVRSEKVPLRGLAIDVSLDRGMLRLDPLTLQLTQGQVGGAASINAREETPVVSVDVRLTQARVENFFASMENGPPLSGALLGRLRLVGRGASTRQAAANANGEIGFVMPRGEIREALAELTGINVVRGLGLLLAKDDSKIDVRCGVAHFQVRNGLMNVDNMVVDTESMLIKGRGTVSLRDETLDLRLQGEPKEPRLIRVAAPIEIGGRLRSPTLGVDAERAAGQTGIAAALGSLVAPLAAILPFIDAGLADDADCRALLASINARPPSPRG